MVESTIETSSDGKLELEKHLAMTFLNAQRMRNKL